MEMLVLFSAAMTRTGSLDSPRGQGHRILACPERNRQSLLQNGIAEKRRSADIRTAVPPNTATGLSDVMRLPVRSAGLSLVLRSM